LDEICWALNDRDTWVAITAERALLSAMGGGCQSPVGAHALVQGETLRLRAISFMGNKVRQAERCAPCQSAAQVGADLAVELKN
jgi:hydroxymethylbilane synthase